MVHKIVETDEVLHIQAPDIRADAAADMPNRVQARLLVWTQSV